MGKIRKAGAIIINNFRMMIVRPSGKEYFINPGGKYENNEDAFECLKRELKEELNVNILSISPYKTYQIEKAAHSDNSLTLDLFIVEIQGKPEPNEEIKEIEWLSRNEFKISKYNLAPSFNEFIPDLINDKII